MALADLVNQAVGIAKQVAGLSDADREQFGIDYRAALASSNVDPAKPRDDSPPAVYTSVSACPQCPGMTYTLVGGARSCVRCGAISALPDDCPDKPAPANDGGGNG